MCVFYTSLGQCELKETKAHSACPRSLLVDSMMGRGYLHVNPPPREAHRGAKPWDKKIKKKGESGGLGWLWQALRRSSGMSIMRVGRGHSQRNA